MDALEWMGQMILKGSANMKPKPVRLSPLDLRKTVHMPVEFVARQSPRPSSATGRLREALKDKPMPGYDLAQIIGANPSHIAALMRYDLKMGRVVRIPGIRPTMYALAREDME